MSILLAARERWDSPSYFWDNAPRVESDFFVIQRTRRGRAFFEKDGRRRDVPSGYAMLFAHGENSAYGYPPAATDTYENEFVVLTGVPVRALFEEIRETIGAVVAMPETASASRCLGLLVSRFQRQALGDRYTESALIYEFLMACFRLQGPEGAESDPIHNAREYLLSNYTRPLTLQEVAEAVGLSREHLSRAFNKSYGEPPKNFLRSLRMARARDLLRASRLPIQEVALNCGYADANSFVRAFGAAHNSSPARFRERA